MGNACATTPVMGHEELRKILNEKQEDNTREDINNTRMMLDAKLLHLYIEAEKIRFDNIHDRAIIIDLIITNKLMYQLKTVKTFELSFGLHSYVGKYGHVHVNGYTNTSLYLSVIGRIQALINHFNMTYEEKNCYVSVFYMFDPDMMPADDAVAIVSSNLSTPAPVVVSAPLLVPVPAPVVVREPPTPVIDVAPAPVSAPVLVPSPVSTPVPIDVSAPLPVPTSTPIDAPVDHPSIEHQASATIVIDGTKQDEDIYA